MRTTLALAALATILGAHSREVTDDTSAIRAERAASNRAIAAHDTAGFGRILAPEFHEIVSTNAQTSGRDEAVQYFGKLFADRPDVVYVRTPDRITVNAQWGQAAESGHWTGRWTSADGVTRNGGEYFAKWRKTNDRWMLLSEIFVQTTCGGTRYCAAPPATVARNGVAEIESFNVALANATRSMSNAATLALWEDGGVSVLPGAAPIVGKPAISAFLDNVMKTIAGARMASFDMKCDDIRVSGD